MKKNQVIDFVEIKNMDPKIEWTGNKNSLIVNAKNVEHYSTQ